MKKIVFYIQKLEEWFNKNFGWFFTNGFKQVNKI